ncbi:MAG TPA: hypothetical protein VG937_11035 [Polyangiaceae bacterium]|nr:hypothetical protein [Polyangiaceae bacterium]
MNEPGAQGGASSAQGGSNDAQGGSSSAQGGTSAGGSAPGGCNYNGVHYEPGQVFGACNECVCDGSSGVICKPVGCVPGTGGAPNSTGGVTSSGGSPGCEFEGKQFPEGSSWPVDCNTCYCKGAMAVCTKKACGSSTGGAAGTGGSAGASTGGTDAQCKNAPIGSFCVLGTPSGDGQDLTAGTPLTVSMRPAGCYSSSCTKLVSSDCNYIGSDGTYWVSGFVCLKTEGGACTDDCGGGGNPVCKPGVTLSEGAYTIGIGGTTLAVKFIVPSHVPNGQLCASMIDQ